MKTLFAKQARLPDGWIRNVEIRIDARGTIVGVLTDGTVPDDAEVVELLIPGMPNVHSHAFQRVLAGRMETAGPGADSFWTWREGMYDCVERVGAEQIQAIATWLYIEMLKAGYTSVAEFHYLHRARGDREDLTTNSDALSRAAEAAGIRMTLLPTLYQFGGFGARPTEQRQRRFVATLDEYLRLQDTLRAGAAENVRIGIAFHSLRAVSTESIAAVLEYRERSDPDAPVHVHVAEQLREVDDCVAWSGQRPVEWLLDRHDVDRNWCAVHATHMCSFEAQALAASGAVAGLCPTTEANLGDGLFPLAEYFDAGGRIAIGSDSHVCVDPWEELRWLEYGQRLRLQKRNVAASDVQAHTGARLIDAALDGGATALGQPVGRIAERYRADFLVIDGADPLLAGCTGDTLLNGLVFGGGANPVTDVMVGGDWVVRDRRHALEDRAADSFAAARRELAGGSYE